MAQLIQLEALLKQHDDAEAQRLAALTSMVNDLGNMIARGTSGPLTLSTPFGNAHGTVGPLTPVKP